MLLQLVYHSQFKSGAQGASSTVRAILEASAINNGRDRITGFLIFDKVNFLQILEGEAIDVERTYARIAQDTRHQNVVVVERRRVDGRTFQDWAMGGYVRETEADDIYIRHGLTGRKEPSSLSAVRVVALAQDLLTFETERLSRRGLTGTR